MSISISVLNIALSTVVYIFLQVLTSFDVFQFSAIYSAQSLNSQPFVDLAFSRWYCWSFPSRTSFGCSLRRHDLQSSSRISTYIKPSTSLFILTVWLKTDQNCGRRAYCCCHHSQMPFVWFRHYPHSICRDHDLSSVMEIWISEM